MTKVTRVAGIDISKTFFDVCFLSEEGEQIRRFAYSPEGLQATGKWISEGTHCVMEATGPYYLRLAVHLHAAGFRVSVVNPLVVRRFAQMRLTRAKTDRADAKMIAAYALSEGPAAWTPPAAYAVKLQQLDTLLTQLQKQHTALLNQQEAFMASGMMDRETKQFLSKALRHLQRQMEHIAGRIEAIALEHHGPMLQNLASVKGIGKKTAIALIVLSGGFTKFQNYRQLSAYIGLSPRIYESGTSVRSKARICKMGMSRIRALLYVCAWSAKQCNGACRQLYERLLAKGKAKRLALIAVANKLIKQAFAIATKGTTYEADYAKNICF